MMKPRNFVIHFFLLLGVFSGCAKTKKVSLDKISGLKQDAGLVSIEPNWFQNSPERFALKKTNGQNSSHLFFDVNPLIDIKKKTLKYVIETPKFSRYRYKLDLKSGQHYLDRLYCKEPDPTGKSLSINKPPFHIGIVPKVYDQLGTPQKIYVFSQGLGKSFQTRDYSARVIGGFVERVCSKGRCTKSTDWRSRLILIGVDNKESKFQSVETIADLKKKVSWSEVEDFFRFGEGSNLIGNDFVPSTKIGVMLSADKVLKYFQKNSLFFDVKRMTTLKRSCYKLYDKIWKDLGSDSKLERELRQSVHLKNKVAITKKIDRNRSSLYNRRFRRTFAKYHSHYTKCEKLVYPASINDDPERFWYFSLYSLVNLLYSEHYYYDCRSSQWHFNALKRSGERANSIKNAFRSCSIANLEGAFKKGLVLLNNLRSKDRSSYRFIDYDNSSYGTHSKIFSWVKVPNKRFQCSQGSEFYLKDKVYPKDVEFRKRDFEFFKQKKVIF